MGIDLTQLGMILKKERKLKKLSQQALANLVGVDQATISRVERGSDKITESIYVKVAKCLGIKVNLENKQELPDIFLKLYQYLQENDQTHAKELYHQLLKQQTIYHNELALFKLISTYYCYLLGMKKELDKAIQEISVISDQFTDEYIMYYHIIIGAYHLLYTEDYHSGEPHLEQAYNYMANHHIRDGFVYYTYAWLSSLNGNHTSSIVLINEAKLIYEEQRNQYRLAAIDNLLGALYLNDGNYKLALDCLLSCKSNEVFYHGNEYNYMLVNGLIGITYLYMKQIDLAVELLEKTYHHTRYHKKKVTFFLLLALKLANQTDKLVNYINQLTDEQDKKLYRKLLLNHAPLTSLDSKHIKEIEQLIKKHNLYSFMYFIMNVAIKDIFSLRHYSIYKNIFDIYLKYRLGIHDV